jgi:hypothetical protein
VRAAPAQTARSSHTWEFSRLARRELTDTLGSVIGQASVGCRDNAPPDLARFKADGGG